MNPEALKLPRSIVKYGKGEQYGKGPEEVFKPERPIDYTDVRLRAVVKPLRLGHHAVQDGQGKSTPVETGKKQLKRPLPRENSVAVLTDINDQDVHGAETVRLSAPFAGWKGGIPVNTTIRNRDISPALKRRIKNTRRSGPKIIG